MTNRLEKLHRSAFPLAVRGTLNKAAFNTKQKTLLQTTEKTFTNRQKNFFKANSKVFIAKGWDVRKMVSTVGMVEGKLKGDSNYAVKDLAQQEKGGSIGGRSFIPISKGARVGGSYSAMVKKRYRMDSIKGIVNARKFKGSTPKEKTIKAALKARKGGLIKSTFENNRGERIIFEVTSLRKTKKGIKLRTKALYRYRANRKVKVKATNFMERSGEMSGRQMSKFYNQEGKRQIERLMKK